MKKISGAIFLLISVLTGAAILIRVIFNFNFIGLYELIGVTSGIGILFSFIVAEINNAHIKIEIIKYKSNKFFITFKFFLLTIVYACFTCAQFWAAYISFKNGHKTIMLEIPTYLFYGCAGFCFLYLSIIAISKIYNIKTI